MAKFNATGFADLDLSFEQFQQLPEKVIDDMLAAGGRVLVAAQKRSIASVLKPSGTFLDSIQMFPKVNSEGKRYVLVYPYGNHHKYQSRVKTKTYARSKHGRTYTTGGRMMTATNNDIGFVHEYGGHGNRARNWMKNANEKANADMQRAMLAVYDEWLKSINL